MRPNLILIMKNNLQKIVRTLFYSLLSLDFFASRYFFWYSFNFCLFSQALYDIYFFHILSFSFYLLRISFYIYLLLALLVFLYHFHNNFLLYLILFLCFFVNKLYYSFLYITKNKNRNKIFYNAPFLSIKLELIILIFASRLLIYRK